MRFIISPAKKMNIDDTLPYRELPRFIDDARLLSQKLLTLSYDEAKRLWDCSDKLALFNYQRLELFEPGSGWDELGSAWLTPAIIAYEGIQYQSMAPSVMTTQQLEYLEEHLRILSGFYGMLRPFDAIAPYRLEMQAKLQVKGAKDLYTFWGDRLFGALREETDTIVNLASVEYAKAVTPFITEDSGVKLVTCLFGDVPPGKKFRQRSTYAKKARGSFVRWCAENNVTNPDEFPSFDVGHHYDADLSTEDTLVFVSE